MYKCLSAKRSLHLNVETTVLNIPTRWYPQGIQQLVSTHHITAHNNGVYNGPLKLKSPNMPTFHFVRGGGGLYSILPHTQFWTNIGVNWEHLAQIYPSPLKIFSLQVSYTDA